jgi:hypothetical protein
VGKSLVELFYGEPHSKSYYLGCSLGGRQGIGSAEKFPRDFDGIVAGAPGVDFNNLISWRAHFFPLTGAIDASNWIPATAWKTWIHDEVLKQCDMNDGVRDGIIEDPMSCIFHPARLLCEGNVTENCLSKEQILLVTHIFSDYKYPNGELIFPAMQPGSEVGAASGLYAGTPWAYSEESQSIYQHARTDMIHRVGSNTSFIVTLLGMHQHTAFAMPAKQKRSTQGISAHSHQHSPSLRRTEPNCSSTTVDRIPK